MFQEYILEEDFNRMSAVRDLLAHQGRVTGVHFAISTEWILSISRDKTFQVHCAETSRGLGQFICSAWCTALVYPFIENLPEVTFRQNFPPNECL